MNSILLTSELPHERHESITDLFYLQLYFSTSSVATRFDFLDFCFGRRNCHPNRIQNKP